jgi:hypothetical protein
MCEKSLYFFLHKLKIIYGLKNNDAITTTIVRARKSNSKSL